MKTPINEAQREIFRQRNRRFYAANRERMQERSRKYYAANKHKMKKSTANVQAWRVRNPEKNKAARAREKRSPGYAARRAAFVKNKRTTDLNFLLASQLRCRINVALKKSGARKSAKTCDLIGCDVPALRAHLEGLFLPGMTWASRSLWHIDHIKPCASFDLTDPAQQRACFHFTNLQPLWADDNQRKWAHPIVRGSAKNSLTVTNNCRKAWVDRR